MSRFSGKCDVYDSFCMIGDPTEENIDAKIAKTNFYIYTGDGKRHKLAIYNRKELIPYYPYLTAMAYHTNEENGRNVVVISSQSFVDLEEDKFLGYEIEGLNRYYRRCKRKKIEYDPVVAWKDTQFLTSLRDDYRKRIAELVGEKHGKATLEDVHNANIHMPMREHYRKMLYNEMIHNGYDENAAYMWCFRDLDPERKRLKDE